jgi:hypothetical protein
MMSIFSPRSSDTTMRTREPRGPTQAPTGSTPSAWEMIAGDAHDLDEAIGDLRDLQFEERLDQLVAATRDDDARTLALRRDVGDHGLDAHAVVVALVPDLLGAWQQGLHSLAQLHQRVAVVGLLDDPGDQLADAILVLVVHHLPLGLTDPLQDHLLGGLGGDPAEIVRGYVAGLDLVLVRGEDLRIKLGVLGLAQLSRLGVDLLLGLLGDLLEQLLLQLSGQDQLEHAKVGGFTVEVDARVLRGAGGLLVSGEQGILERRHQRLGVDSLFLLEAPDRFDDLAAHAPPPESSGTRLDRRIPSNGMSTTPRSASSDTTASPAAAMVPVKFR